MTSVVLAYDIGDWAGIATIIGVAVAVVAAGTAVGSLRSQAKSQGLNALLATNEVWGDLVSRAATVELSESTVDVVRSVYRQLHGESGHSVLDAGSGVAISVKAPYAASLLFPVGLAADAAPVSESDYVDGLRDRVVAYGFVRESISSGRVDGASASALQAAGADLDALDKAMASWVNGLNALAELYEQDIIDQRLFVGVRSVALVQALFAAEPHILWRNSTTSGRWGLRLIGLGEEVRCYYRRSVLQHAVLRSRTEASGYEASDTSPGLGGALGAIVAPGAHREGRLAHWVSERRLRAHLGDAFTLKAKRRQRDEIEKLPRSASSGLPEGAVSWDDLCRDPGPVRSASSRTIASLLAAEGDGVRSSARTR